MVFYMGPISYFCNNFKYIYVFLLGENQFLLLKFNKKKSEKLILFYYIISQKKILFKLKIYSTPLIFIDNLIAI